MVWRINKIIRNWKDTAASCLCCIYIWTQTQIFWLYANNSSVEKIIEEKLMPTLFDGFPISVEFRKILALPCKLGGNGIIDPNKNANGKYNNSREMTSQLTNLIKQQEYCSTVSDENIKNCKSSIKKKRTNKHLNISTSLRVQMSSKEKRVNNIA